MTASFTTGGGGSWYGLGQLGSQNASGKVCNPARHPCTAHVPDLNREAIGPVSMTSVKYWIGIPWAYNRRGWGVFLNQPGEGVVDVSSGRLAASFQCQKQFDMFVAARPAFPSPSPDLVPGLPHVTLIELRKALVSYQDHHMLLLTLAGRPRKRRRARRLLQLRARDRPASSTARERCLILAEQKHVPYPGRGCRGGEELRFAQPDRW